ncbi:hypothetical protein F5Y11DRAFT_360348 [Daldinia sp. FL1419]|nr:hypothetical protein F5Y11DRAFT_360348 [Daldinia sp. FL1419]
METYKDSWGPQQDECAVVIDSTETAFELVEHEHDDRPRKRNRTSDCASTTTGEKQSQKSFTKRRAQDRRLWLACPYAKKDPVRYRDCYRYFLARVRDVKQHIARCHRKPIHCPVCSATFQDEDERDSHIGLRSCTPQPSVVMEGISEKQKRALSQRVSSKLPEEQQWFAVFDVIFSPHPRPRTPYRDRELSDDLCVFQDFMAAQGPTLLAEFLEARGVATCNLPCEERDLDTFKKDILGDGLQVIIDRWTSENAKALEPASASHSLRSSPTLDSGIAMQNNHQKATRKPEKTGDPQETERDILKKGKGIYRDDTQNIFNREADLENQADMVLRGLGAEQGSQSAVDKPTRLATDIPIHHNQKFSVEIEGASAIPQFDYTFPITTEVPDLIDFNMGWPP